MNYYGFNGAGFWENETPETLQWVNELGTNLIVRFGGGSISRFYEPFTYRKGYGMTSGSIARYYEKYGSIQQKDEDDGTEGAEDWLRKESEQPNYSYLDKIIEWQISNPTYEIAWVTNILNSSIQEQVNTIKYLVDNGVKISVVECGNEVYGKYSFDPTLYLQTYSQLRTAVLAVCPGIKFSLISGNFSGRKEHTKWNEALNLFDKNQYDYITIHYYITEDKAPNSYSTLPAKPLIVDYSTTNSTLQVPFEHYVNEILLGDHLQNEISTAKSFYNKPIIVTEWNTKPSVSFGNTLVNAMWIYKQLINTQEADALLLHNGVSPDKFGIICKSQPVDDILTSMARRTGYWALKFANETKNAPERYLWENIENGIYLNYDSNRVVDCFINYTNNDSGATLNWDKAKYKPKSIKLKYIEGDFLYSSAGSAGFQAKKQPKNFEIKDEIIYDFSNVSNSGSLECFIPAYSFGYIDAEFELLPPPPPPPIITPKGGWWKKFINFFK